jgi:hypothetical protein
MRFTQALLVLATLVAPFSAQAANEKTPKSCPSLVLGGFEAGERGQMVLVDPLAPLLSNFTAYTKTQLFRALYSAMPEQGWVSRNTALTPADRNAKAHPDSPSVFLHNAGFNLGKSGVKGQPDGFHPEMDRGLTSFYVLQLILKDDYEGFVQAQKTEAPKAMPLVSRERFSFWRKFFIDLLAVDAAAAAYAYSAPTLPTSMWCDSEKLRTLLVTMAVHDLGKSKDWSDSALKVSTQISHDTIFVRGIKENPFMAPSLAALNPDSQKVIFDIFNARFNMGQDVQFEAPDAMLARVQGMDAFTLRMYIAHLILDVAGAHAAVDPNGARLFHAGIETSYTMGMRNMERVLAGDSIATIRRDFARDRVQEFGMKVDTDEEYLLAKLVLYSRALSTKKAKAAVEAFQSLPKTIQAILRKELLMSGIDDGWATLLEYGPQLIDNLEQEAVRTAQPNPEFSARVAGFKQIARIFQQLRTESLKDRRGSGMLHVNINAIASAVKAIPPAVAPNLDDVLYDFLIDGDQGSVSLVQNIKPMSRNAKAASLKAILDGSDATQIVFVGMGGGSDVMQGAALDSLVEKVDSGKTVLGFVSVRGVKTGSVTAGTGEGVKRTVVDGGKNPLEGVYEILPGTKLPGRSFEPALAAENRSVYTVLYDSDKRPADLAKQIDSAVRTMASNKKAGKEKVLLIAIDTGGDVLIDVDSNNTQAAGVTAQQDADVLLAAHDLAVDSKRYDAIVGVVAAGIEDPRQFAPTGAPAGATFFAPSDIEKQTLLANYSRWQLTPAKPHPQGLYSRTAFAWQLALGGRTGASFVPLPENSVLHQTNPWDPFPYLYPDASGVLFYTAEGLLEQLPHTRRQAAGVRLPMAPIVLPDLSSTPALSNLAAFNGRKVSIVGSGSVEDFAKCVFLAKQLRAQGKEIGMVAFMGPTGKKGNPLEKTGDISDWFFDDGLRVIEITPTEESALFERRMRQALQWSYMHRETNGEITSGKWEDAIVFVDSNWHAYGDDSKPENAVPRALAKFLASQSFMYPELLIAEVPGAIQPPAQVSKIIELGKLRALKFNSTEVAAFRKTVGQVGASPVESRLSAILVGPLLHYPNSVAENPLDTHQFGAPTAPRQVVQVDTSDRSIADLPPEIQQALAQDYRIGRVENWAGGEGMAKLAGPEKPGSYGFRFVLVAVDGGQKVVFRGRILEANAMSLKYVTETGEIRYVQSRDWHPRYSIAIREY